MTTEETGTTQMSTGPVNDDAGPVSLGTALWPWGVRGAGDLADALSRAVGVVGNQPGVARVSVRCPEPGSDLPHVAVVVTDPAHVRRLAQEQAHAGTDRWVNLGPSQQT